MGNTQSSNYSEQYPLGNSPLIFLRKTKFGRGPEALHTWTAHYNSFRSTCELELTKTNADYNQDQELTISIHDHASTHPNDYFKFTLDVTVKQGLLLGDAKVTGTASVLRLPVCKTPMAQDYSHGVSLVATICSTSDDGGFSVEIEKPSKHSKGELLKMFDDVKANGWWPHPTTSDWPIQLPNQNNNIPAIPSYNNNRSINNGGSFNGNGNGCYTVNQHFYGQGYQRIAFRDF
ncbi:uncharacterized protein [Phaseolus vulgaris]|uniref:uncharacterized protein n=1 Tax=Phaseolus vulgaris TaxID=3885 RepID=UPI0035C9FB80